MTISVHQPDDHTALTYELKKITVNGENQSWFSHEKADVAIIPIKINKKLGGIIRVLDLNLLLSDENSFDKFKDREATVVGFPLKIGTIGKFYPSKRNSNTSSNLFTYKRADKAIETTFFVLEDPSVQGYSGAPVYTLTQKDLGGGITIQGGLFSCIGLVHGTIRDDTGGKLALIVPSYFIVETINIFENKN